MTTFLVLKDTQDVEQRINLDCIKNYYQYNAHETAIEFTNANNLYGPTYVSVSVETIDRMIQELNGTLKRV